MYNNNIFKFNRLAKHDATNSVPPNGTLIMLPNKFCTAQFQYNPNFSTTQSLHKIGNNSRTMPNGALVS